MIGSTTLDDDAHELEFDVLSDDVRISKQTLVRWSDRGLIDAALDWTISDDNEELRMIRIAPRSLEFLRGFAEEYREDTVSRTEARRILKMIDRSQVQKLLRQGDLTSKKVDDETRCWAIAHEALRARRLQSPSIKRSNVYVGLSWLSTLIFCTPGITKGFVICRSWPDGATGAGERRVVRGRRLSVGGSSPPVERPGCAGGGSAWLCGRAGRCIDAPA